jgi:hypothetical protein
MLVNGVSDLLYALSSDPAAEVFKYPVAFDIRDLISLEDVMEELKLGPNGWVATPLKLTLKPSTNLLPCFCPLDTCCALALTGSLIFLALLPV